MIKIGLMGCGVVANYGHLPAILEAPSLELHVIYDPNEEGLRRAAEKFGAPHACGDVEAFMTSGIEAVSITSPAPCHLDNVLDAARHGLPVLCEKPLAMNDAEAAQMIEAMEKAGQPLYVAFCYRYSSAAIRIRDLIRQGAVGKPLSLRLIYNWHCHGKYETDESGRKVVQKRREGRMLEGGPMVDCGTHQIDLARWWLGSEVVHFAGHGAWVDDYEAPDHVYLHMDHASGAHTMVEMSYSYCHTSREARNDFIYEIIGTEGVIRYDRRPGEFFLMNAEGTQHFDCGHEKNFTRMYEEFAQALQTGNPGFMASARDGMEVVRIARTATEQAMADRVARP